MNDRIRIGSVCRFLNDNHYWRYNDINFCVTEIYLYRLTRPYKPTYLDSNFRTVMALCCFINKQGKKDMFTTE